MEQQASVPVCGAACSRRHYTIRLFLSNMEYTLTIAEKIVETPDVVTVRFKQPAFRKLKYRAGQYITVVVSINDRKYRRPYSVSSVYGLDSTIDITVKVVPGGRVSGHIFQRWKPGDIVTVMEPMGDYCLPDKHDCSTLYCWCAGSGIAPNYAIIRHALQHCADVQKVVLVYCNKHDGATIYKEALDQLVALHNNRFIIYPIHSQPQPGQTAYWLQRLNSDCIRQLLQATEDAAGRALHFVCGPPGMNQLVTATLADLGVAPERVFTEHFQQAGGHDLPETIQDAMAVITLNGQTHELLVPKGTSLLDTCLDAGLDFAYSCQAGSCGLCKAGIKAGGVYSTHPAGNHIAGEDCLLCSSYPVTEQLSLQITEP